MLPLNVLASSSKPVVFGEHQADVARVGVELVAPAARQVAVELDVAADRLGLQPLDLQFGQLRRRR